MLRCTLCRMSLATPGEMVTFARGDLDSMACIEARLAGAEERLRIIASWLDGVCVVCYCRLTRLAQEAA